MELQGQGSAGQQHILEPQILDEDRREQKQVRAINHANAMAAVRRPQEYTEAKVISQMPDSCKEEILQSNLANLKLQNKLSQLSNSPPQDMKGKALKLIQQASSVSMASNHSQQITSYSKFFIIKSYTEEDVHKAIKYKIWSSTERGNNILDTAYKNVQQLK